jgi:hypothetical protein
MGTYDSVGVLVLDPDGLCAAVSTEAPLHLRGLAQQGLFPPGATCLVCAQGTLLMAIHESRVVEVRLFFFLLSFIDT